jgi:hypothetical protein
VPQHGDYGEPELALFAWSGKKGRDNYVCPSTKEIAGMLAKNPDDPLGLICLGDFVKSTTIWISPEGGERSAHQHAGAVGAELGSGPSLFPGKPFSRGEAYQQVMADKHASHDLQAYALFRAVRCYAPSGHNDCGGDDVDSAVRRSWFKALKKNYSDTSWAKSLKFYW